jgi:hypothetical protein
MDSTKKDEVARLPYFSSEKIDLNNTIVLEVCQNCKQHAWNTRHDERQYREYALNGKTIVLLFSC